MFSNELLSELAEIYQKQCGLVDNNQFRDDVLRFLYVHRLLKRFVNAGKIHYRLLLNHVIILHNVFTDKATEVLLDYISSDLQPQLYALLHTIYRLPEGYDDSIDQSLYNELQREIGNHD